MKDWRENAMLDIEVSAQETRLFHESPQTRSTAPIQEFQQQSVAIGATSQLLPPTIEATRAFDADLGNENEAVMDDNLQYSEEDQINVIVPLNEQNQQAMGVLSTSISPEFHDQFLW
jgi:hypothetical protein